MPLDETLRKTTMHMILCEPNFGKRILDPQFITIPPPLYEGPEDEVSCYPMHIGTILKQSHFSHPAFACRRNRPRESFIIVLMCAIHLLAIPSYVFM